jgi:Carbohydrate-binding domain-containing protein Cthe_2159
MQNSIKNISFLAFLFTINFLISCKKDDGSSVVITDSQFSVKSDYTVASVLAENSTNHDLTSDYNWDATSEINIVLNGNSITCNSSNVLISGKSAIIRVSGNYNITGALADGFILVATPDSSSEVRLILNGVNINNPIGPAIYITKLAKAIVVLKDGTDNYLSDGAAYTFANTSETEPNATLFSKSDLTICGEGKLSVNAKYEDAICSKDGLIVASGHIDIVAKDDGLRGKNYLIVKNGNFVLKTGGDGMKSDHALDAKKGYIHVIDGDFVISAAADAIQAITDILIEKGTFNIISGGGSNSSSANDTSKGLKAGNHIIIDAGTFEISAADDALHSNSNITVNSGNFSISSKDDGIHADTSVSINGGDVVISKSFEGIESRVIIINSGNINVTSQDDGINLSGESVAGGSSHNAPNGGSNSNFYLSMRGGFVVVNSGTDGLDSNGAIEMTGGTMLINGPSANGNGALDFDYSFNISGGFLVAVGSSNMAGAPTSGSTQNSVMVKLGSNQAAGSLIHIQNVVGDDILTFKSAKGYSSLAFSSPDFKNGSYSVFKGGNCDGAETDGLYTGGTYTAGTKFKDFTVSSVTTKVQ